MINIKQRSLILLGLLMGQSQHGYQINEFIEKNLSTVTDMKKPTAYATLDKLNANGYIDIQHEQEGNRPPRKVYSINEKGQALFFQLLVENLTHAENYHYHGDIGLMFIDYLPLHQSIEVLTARKDQNEKMLEQYLQMPLHSVQRGVNLAIQHKLAMVRAELQFLEETVNRLKENKQLRSF